MVETWATRTPDVSDCGRLDSTKTILGRAAVGYRCNDAAARRGLLSPGVAWLDEVTGIVLEERFMVAEKLDLDPGIDENTFSTRPPADAEVTVIAAKSPPTGDALPAPDFTLDLVQGGDVRREDLAGEPFVLAFFSSICTSTTTERSVPVAGTHCSPCRA